MLILSMLLAMVAPSLSGFGAGRKADEAAAQILALAEYARAQAVAERRTYRLNFVPQDQAYWLTVQNGGLFQELPSEFGRPFSLPDNVAAEWDAPQEGGAYYVEFLPTGRSRPVRIRIIARDGQETYLSAPSATEPMRVVSAQELGLAR